jgi:peptidyl-prolyl cis-trans isomerase A (cyclophilin A)
MTNLPRIANRLNVLIAGVLVAAGCDSGTKPVAPTPIPTAPSLGPATSNAPETLRVKFTTTKGDFVVAVHRDWAPNGSDRFRELVEAGYYDGCKFFRAIPNFMVQFGINGDPALNAKWRDNHIPDDPVQQSNQRGKITFATSGPDSRTTQLFINYKDNSNLDSQGFAPFGEVVEGMDVVDSINQEYAGAPSDDQPLIQEQGNAFLEQKYPNLDGIITTTIVEPEAK